MFYQREIHLDVLQIQKRPLKIKQTFRDYCTVVSIMKCFGSQPVWCVLLHSTFINGIDQIVFLSLSTEPKFYLPTFERYIRKSSLRSIDELCKCGQTLTQTTSFFLGENLRAIVNIFRNKKWKCLLKLMNTNFKLKRMSIYVSEMQIFK